MFAAWLIGAVQASSLFDLCAQPVDDPKSPAPYCVIEQPLLIETPYYTITIEPRQVVHFMDEGRFVEILPAPRQSPIGITISVDREPEEELLRSLGYRNCPRPVPPQGSLMRCERVDAGYVSRQYIGRSGTHIVSVSYYTGPRAKESPGEEERFERMLESIVLEP